MTILVTGTAGFIGYHVAERLLDAGEVVIGLDSLTPYYDVSLKEARVSRLRAKRGFTETRTDLSDAAGVMALFAEHRPSRVVHLAAQAGVRYSLENPESYINSNISGFLSVLEACRQHPVDHLVYASTSSVFGADREMPFDVKRGGGHPLSLYAASKRTNELMAHSYAHLFKIPVTGLRFFTVYGPWGRPDMALFRFTHAILSNQPLEIYNYGEMQRDFTYVGDIVEGIIRILDVPATANAAWDGSDQSTSAVAPFRVHNIGHGSPVNLMDYVRALEDALGRKAEYRMLPMQPGDVHATWADTNTLEAAIGYAPKTPVTVGVQRFVDWYLEYYEKSAEC